MHCKQPIFNAIILAVISILVVKLASCSAQPFRSKEASWWWVPLVLARHTESPRRIQPAKLSALTAQLLAFHWTMPSFLPCSHLF